MSPDVPPVHVVSYAQLRATAGDGIGSYGSVRRFRVNLSTEPTQSERWFVQLFTKENNQSPTDGELWLHDVSWRKKTLQGTWTVGQLRPPFSLQRLTIDRELLVPDRATASDLLSPVGGLGRSFGREIGVQFDGKPHQGLTYSLGLFRGSGALQQVGAGTGGLLWVGRATQQLGSVQWGGSLAVRHNSSRDFSKVFAGAKNFNGWDTRAGLDVLAHQGPWRGSAEYLVGKLDGSVKRRAEGGYADVVRKLTPSTELVAQVQTYSPDIGTNGLTLGVNVIPSDKRNRIQLDYIVQRQHRVELQYQYFLFGK
ncbi:porin [Armatimonas rosea]|uniref:Porin n=1 Tax=Armatimonas rosea TaxID=685828 RepID=A0A7W9SWB1_ARMRO|nr:hypothetical protein [Armatimonas rosea]